MNKQFPNYFMDAYNYPIHAGDKLQIFKSPFKGWIIADIIEEYGFKYAVHDEFTNYRVPLSKIHTEECEIVYEENIN